MRSYSITKRTWAEDAYGMTVIYSGWSKDATEPIGKRFWNDGSVTLLYVRRGARKGTDPISAPSV